MKNTPFDTTTQDDAPAKGGNEQMMDAQEYGTTQPNGPSFGKVRPYLKKGMGQQPQMEESEQSPQQMALGRMLLRG